MSPRSEIACPIEVLEMGHEVTGTIIALGLKELCCIVLTPRPLLLFVPSRCADVRAIGFMGGQRAALTLRVLDSRSIICK